MTDEKALVPVQHEVVSIVQNQIKITEKIITSLVRNTCESNKYGISCLTDIRKAAEQGDVNAQCNLGKMYRCGEGVPQDYAEAVHWYRKAAKQGLADAQFWLGVMYRLGMGVLLDNKEAFKWFCKAAEQGQAAAYNRLGHIYKHGDGVPKDIAEAVKCYKKAVELGDEDAPDNLGRMYWSGDGVPKDDTEAVKWYRKAAEQGQADLELHDYFKSKNSQPTNVQADEKKPKKGLTPEQLKKVVQILKMRLKGKGIVLKKSKTRSEK